MPILAQTFYTDLMLFPCEQMGEMEKASIKLFLFANPIYQTILTAT